MRVSIMPATPLQPHSAISFAFHQALCLPGALSSSRCDHNRRLARVAAGRRSPCIGKRRNLHTYLDAAIAFVLNDPRADGSAEAYGKWRRHDVSGAHRCREAAITERYLGTWSIARSIFDRDRLTTIACAGSATLRVNDGAIDYDEAVSYELSGKLIRATRAYRFASADGAIVATFNDGAPFFTLRLDAAGVGRAHHLCGDDRYDLTLTLRDTDDWYTLWTVAGTKRIRIATHYARAG
jgi:hypothetical protein